MDIHDDGALDEAYERLHRTGPEYEGWLTNHGPMAAESMVRNGYGRAVHRWLDEYVRRLEELPGGTSPIDPGEWREALGDARRLGDWLAFFDREVRERPWREVLVTWWPRLLPGIAAGATHGVIRTGHAAHTLLCDEAPTADGPRVAELAQALGYWAARWQPVPAAAAPSGAAHPSDALQAIPRVPDQSKGVRHRLGQLTDLPEWPSALTALRPAESAGRPRAGQSLALWPAKDRRRRRGSTPPHPPRLRLRLGLGNQPTARQRLTDRDQHPALLRPQPGGSVAHTVALSPLRKPHAIMTNADEK